MSARRTSIARPAMSESWASSSPVSGIAAGSAVTRWLGAMSESTSSQCTVIAVSTLPLSGIGSARMTSNAEMRSDATMSNWSSPTA